MITGRAVVAVCSVGVYPCLYWLRETFPERALLTAGLFFVASPLVVFTSRFFRQDILLTVSLLLLFAVYTRYRRNSNRVFAFLFGVSLALPVLIKEISYVLLPLVAVPVAVTVLYEYYSTGRLRQALDGHVPLTRPRPFLTGLVPPLVVFYSSWPPFTNADFLWFVAEALLVWVTRSAGAAPRELFHLQNFATHAPHVAALAGVGLVTTVYRTYTGRARTSLVSRWVLLSWLVGGWMFFALVSDSDLWQSVYLFAPLAILAGVGVSDAVSWVSGHRRARAVVGRLRRSTDRSRGVVASFVLVWLLLSVGVTLHHQDISLDGDREPYPDDEHYERLSSVRQQAVDSGCAVYLVNTADPVASWVLHDVNHERVRKGEVPLSTPAIVVSDRAIPEFDDGREHRNASGLHVYAPRGECN